MADIFAFLAEKGIRKKILHPGKGGPPQYEDGTKLYFHYKTTKADEERTVIDDSHGYEKPMEILLGKKFKLEVWEVLVNTMRDKEVAEFLVEQTHLDQYPIVSKQLREIFGKAKKQDSHHCCGMMAMSEQGLGHTDLDDLVKNPQPLIFIIEITKVERAGSFEKEVWSLTDDEKIEKIPRLKDQGNQLYKQQSYADAAEKYGEAIGMLDQLALKEKPGEPEWEQIEDQKIPFLLNFSQCKLCLDEYYTVIEHTSTVIKRDKDNVKALFRRAKAHVGAWNPTDAREDFERVMSLDSTLTKAVTKELHALDELQKTKDLEDKQKLKGMFDATKT